MDTTNLTAEKAFNYLKDEFIKVQTEQEKAFSAWMKYKSSEYLYHEKQILYERLTGQETGLYSAMILLARLAGKEKEFQSIRETIYVPD
jgi:hypothetical protein